MFSFEVHTLWQLSLPFLLGDQFNLHSSLLLEWVVNDMYKLCPLFPFFRKKKNKDGNTSTSFIKVCTFSCYALKYLLKLNKTWLRVWFSSGDDSDDHSSPDTEKKVWSTNNIWHVQTHGWYDTELSTGLGSISFKFKKYTEILIIFNAFQ